jgi:hypothetical protein
MPTSGPERARERARQEHALVVLARVLDGCREAGVEALPVKGVLTGRLLYTDPGERPLQDVDLRIRPRDLPVMERAGRRFGWRCVSRSLAYRTIAFDILGFLVEFECHVGPPGVCRLQVEDMLRRARPSVDPLGLPYLRPDPHDHVLLLCVNAFKDKLVDAPPGSVRDLELFASRSEFVEGRFVALAAECKTVTIAWIVAGWLAERFQSAPWGRIRDDLGRLAPRRRYASAFRRVALRERRGGVSRQALRVLARAGSDDRRYRWAALGTMAIAPVTTLLAGLARRNIPGAPRTQARAGVSRTP